MIPSPIILFQSRMLLLLYFWALTQQNDINRGVINETSSMVILKFDRDLPEAFIYASGPLHYSHFLKSTLEFYYKSIDDR